MIKDMEHNTQNECCWCNPKIEVMENGNKVVIHNDTTPEKVRELDNIILAISTADSFAELLREVAKVRGKSIKSLSVVTGLSRNTISAILSGAAINKAKLSTLSKIAHSLSCDLRMELKPFEHITMAGDTMGDRNTAVEVTAPGDTHRSFIPGREVDF